MDIKKYFHDKKIGIIMGGWSAEREISLQTGSAVKKALTEEGFNAVEIDVDKKEFINKIKNEKIDFAFIALHGPFGEDGTVQAVLDLIGVPYTGSGMLTSSVSMNKIFTKWIFIANNITTPDYEVLKKGQKLEHLNIKFPVVVKPATQGSAIGITKVLKIEDMAQALNVAFRYDCEILIEHYVRGKEITVGVLGDIVLPIIEIVPKNSFYDYEAKYVSGMSAHLLPAGLDEVTYKRAQECAGRIYSLFNCCGAVRIDMIVDDKDDLHVLEINTIPGMTQTSLLPEAAKFTGIGFNQLVLKIIELSIKQKNIECGNDFE